MNHPENTRRIAITALFTAASLLLSFVQIPIIPAMPWLMYDPSGIVCLIAACAFGPRLGAATAIISWIPRLFTGPFGAIMGMVSTSCLVIPAGFIYNRHRGRAGSLAGMLIGAVISITASCALNLVITPLYYPVFSMRDVATMIIPFLLPFNLIKMTLHVLAAQMLLKSSMAALHSLDQRDGSTPR
ncbi:membrane protein [Coriobacterium glomerans PW2]|uniref:Riboflavin transporter n=1 Tax=Coriobacterium glomerans (strain ATCC 49209 / DSM 20642 / JCM 10262 / PW2) TaxID=700015 RepID=F2NAF0_CORGP|nr:ECF transporter S component [Coriobacterium glomerans]AEB06336.1 membrane protein [Coriobacterium glomerans PW2]